MNGTNRSSNGGSGLVGRVQKRAFEYSVAQALTVLGKTPEGSYKWLGKALERGAGDDQTKRMVAAWIQRYLSPGNPGAAWLKHLLTSVDPNVRRRYVARFITNVALREGPFSHTLPDGREVPVPGTMVISPTMRCNLKCVGCYAGAYADKDELTAEEVLRVIGEARDLGVKFFVISGGEPFVYKPLFDIVGHFDDCSFQVYTNGHLIDAKMAKKMVKLGNVIPAISIEGFQPETDARRGAGAYERVMKAMDCLREAGALFAFSVTATQRNLETVTSDAFMEMLVEKGAHYGYYFSYIPIGRAPDLDLMPTPAQRNRLRIAVNHFRNTYPILMADFWNDGSLTEGCLSGGRNYLHINSHGDVEPCVFAHFAVDNIREKSLAECLASDFFCALRKAAPYGSNLLRPCPIIDHPQVMRGLVKRFGARPTHDGAETIIEDLAGFLDNYAKGVKEVYDPIWAEEYHWTAAFHGKPQYDWRQRAGQEAAVAAGGGGQ